MAQCYIGPKPFSDSAVWPQFKIVCQHIKKQMTDQDWLFLPNSRQLWPQLNLHRIYRVDNSLCSETKAAASEPLESCTNSPWRNSPRISKWFFFSNSVSFKCAKNPEQEARQRAPLNFFGRISSFFFSPRASDIQPWGKTLLDYKTCNYGAHTQTRSKQILVCGRN